MPSITLPAIPTVVVVLVLLVAPGVARADTQTVAFDDLPIGTTVSDQYADAGGTGEGVSFGIDNTGVANGIAPVVEGQDQQPANHVLTVCQCSGEFHTINLWESFGSTKQHVSMDIGALALPGTQQLALTISAYDAYGKYLLGVGAVVTVVPGDPLQTVSIDDPQGRIAFLNIAPDFAPTTSGSGYPLVVIDNLAYDIPAPGAPPPPPAYAIHWTGPSYPGADFGTSVGNSVTTSLTVTRVNGSSGPLNWQVSGLPSGITPTFTPASPTDAGTVQLRFDVAADAPNTSQLPVTVTATPVNSAVTGPGPQSVTIPLTIVTNYELQVGGIEVVQSVQSLRNPTSGGAGQTSPDLPQLPYRDTSNPDAPVKYQGVEMAAGGRTVARVFASVMNPAGVLASGIGLELYGYNAFGQPLPGSPLVGDARIISPDPRPFENWDNVTAAPSSPASAAWNIVLPDSWTHGTISLRAVLTTPAPQFGSLQPQQVCSTQDCADSSFTLTGIPFITATGVKMTLLGLTFLGDKPLESPGQVFRTAEGVVPTYDGGLDFNHVHYTALVDVGDVFENLEGCLALAAPGDETDDCGENANDDSLSKVLDWADSNFTHRILIGVSTGATVYGVMRASIGTPYDSYPKGVVTQTRPLTSVAHELFHALGRAHASGACNADQGEYWPPDQMGYLHALGFDRWGTGPGLFSTIAPVPGQAFDFMGYCAHDNDSWISDLGWEETLNYLHTHNGADAATDRATASAAGGALHVLGFATDKGVTISYVEPMLSGPGTAPLVGPADSSYRVVVHDAAGATLANVPMLAIASHIDPLGTPIVTFDATVPLHGIAALSGDAHAAAVDAPASVAIMQNGAIAATRVRSTHPPRVRVLAPSARAIVGRRRSVTIRYLATAPRGTVLTAKIDYSINDGRSFQTVWMGPARGHATLPSSMFAGTRRGRVRVRISDGFNEVAAISGRFSAVGSAPTVTIASPTADTTGGADSGLNLIGTAFDDRGTQITGRALRWYVGNRLVGHGPTLYESGFPTGRVDIHLVANARGRSATATVVIRVAPVAPRVLSILVPLSLPPGARKVTLRLSTNVPATLIAGAQRFAVSRTPRRISIRIARGRTPLSLHLTLHAGRLQSRFTVVVRR
jgi:hypothetical protein